MKSMNFFAGILLSTLLMACGEDQPVAQAPQSEPAPQATPDTNVDGSHWGLKGEVENGELRLIDQDGRVLHSTTDFEVRGDFAIYAGGTVSLLGPTYPYYGYNYFYGASPWTWGTYAYPYWNSYYYQIGFTCWSSYNFYQYNGLSFVYFTGAVPGC